MSESWMRARVVSLILCVLATGVSAAADRGISSLGRIEPHNGVIRLAGPSELAVVSELLVDEGDHVEAQQLLAHLDTHAIKEAEIQRVRVALEHAKRVQSRQQALKQGSFQSEAALDEARRDVEVFEAELVVATAQLERAVIRAPVAGEVLAVHARAGERIGVDGLLELGDTRRMYVVAEVYETDIGMIRTGQPAIARSPALPDPASGKVERIGKMIGKNDVLDLDPVARMDSRVVEVFILLDDPAAVADLTNLQVDVVFGN